jgi:hypothetical protein
VDKEPEKRADPLQSVERPIRGEATANTAWGSDAIAAMLRLDIPFVALNPGASYRGLNDSLVNFLGNERPQMLLCLREESAGAIAHGWAKVTERPCARAGLASSMSASPWATIPPPPRACSGP